MKKALQHRGWNSGTRQRAVNRALALAVLTVPMVVVTQSVQAQSFSVLYSFNAADGVDTKPGLVLDKEGNLYGTTPIGGIGGDGEVFKLDTAGTETVLHSFTGPDGIEPSAGLIRDEEGNLYGTTLTGNAPSLGTVFKLDTTNTETVLHGFTGPDGANPEAGLVRDKEGNLYGTTFGGGTSGEGTVFKLDTTGMETVLYSFTGGADGANPHGSLILDKAGNLYGTTYLGGLLNCFGAGCGVVFKLDTTGTETVLHSFTGPDGANPDAGLVRDKEGNLYGTTSGGGPSKEGTVFKLDTTPTETVLYSFTGLADGAGPLAGLVRDKAGNLYGTTNQGGNLSCQAPSGCGVVFKVDPAGVETVLHSFTGGADGSVLYGDLVQDKAGNLYGTTSNGGASGVGTVFKLTPGKSSTSTSFISSLNPSIYGQKVTWTATVTSSGSITPTGTVRFTWSGYTIGSATLNSSSVGALTKSNLNADAFPLTAVYAGDANSLGSTSAVLTQVVQQTTSAAAITSLPNPSTQGQAVTFTAKISSPTVVPTGPVTFTAGKTVLGTAQLGSGHARLTISSLPVGSTKVTVTYNGDSNIAKSLASVNQTVQ
jgi:uncharacterized repeat protein (TIGR03803 family)